jgi:Lhr-like helicase
MKNPLATFESIRDYYITYLETAFRIGDERIQSLRRKMLESPDTLATEPYLEPLPKYRASGIRIDDLESDQLGATWLPGFSAHARKAFVKVCLGGLLPADENNPARGRFDLYPHQLQMLARGVQRLKPGIVTSGTGSGKTESFLLPLIASIVREGVDWKRVNGERPAANWWQVNGERPNFSREREERPAAVRALVIYPMNALVEDQMVRLRRALDSDSATSAITSSLNGNKIYFGRYTGATPVTGWLRHPRINKASEKTKEQVRSDELRAYLREADKTYRAAVDHEVELNSAGDNSQDGLRFNFPRTNGAELLSRWEMHRTPPDILITNTSMLSTMLVREIDDQIFKKTRDWITSSDDSYFYLVLDELHLHRGSAGTEIAYLLKTVLERLGLNHPAHRHKLRILCSSASLPIEGAEAEKSLDFLWGFFQDAGFPENSSREDWKTAIVRGESLKIDPIKEIVDLNRFINAIEGIHAHQSNDIGQALNRTAWEKVAAALNVADSGGSVEDLVGKIVIKAGELLESACVEKIDIRATSVSGIASKIFGTTSNAESAVSALVWLRSCSDDWQSWFHKEFNAKATLPRFRVHTFIRALEGLFVAPRVPKSDASEESRALELFSDLSVDSGVRYGIETEGGQSRRVDLLYCECCGSLFFGGRRGGGGSKVEFLPSDPDTAALPERAKILQVEQNSAKNYAIFFPAVSRFKPFGPEDPESSEAQGSWVPADFDPYVATAAVAPPTGHGVGKISGWLYVVPDDPKQFRYEKQKKQFSSADAGSAFPFQCPSCSISYRKRKRGKNSPLRGFRVGFSKTSQLLASALMLELQKTRSDDRLICFSDSRQDAAHTALDLESGHHDDVRRELVVHALQDEQRKISNPLELQAQLAALSKEISQEQLDPANIEQILQMVEKGKRLTVLQNQIRAGNQDCVRLKSVLEPENPEAGELVRPILQELIEAGIHPTDKAGVSSIPSSADASVSFSWQQLFESSDRGWRWRRDDSLKDELREAYREVSRDLVELVSEVIFSKTYFALEESGWGYPCFPLVQPGMRASQGYLDALIRVSADQYRLDPSAFDFPVSPWLDGASIKGKSLAFLSRACEATGRSVSVVAQEFIERLEGSGHANGIISVRNICFKMASETDPYWRCENCGRVHLHRGAEICTRCYVRLPQQPTGTAGSLRMKTFLGKRVVNSPGIRRLRAEELTGITENPAARLRRFKGILIAEDDDILPVGSKQVKADTTLNRKANIVDVLSVTTTMEVGVDIGELRAVYQANMSPQRFNYQQRVGRAGRRGQAYSMVLTLCRSKSHDLHYFFNPREITGDPPPPPFLTKSVDNIAVRIILKNWMVCAFRNLRERYPENWIGDELRTRPDNHGEFCLVEDLTAAKTLWFPRIVRALSDTRKEISSLIGVFFKHDPDRRARLEKLFSTDFAMDAVSAVLADPAMRRKGLAEALADHGHFPMYGMPSRIRVLHTRPKRVRREIEFQTMDRDIEIAIQEFAPGRLLLQDKRVFLTIGFAGDSIIPTRTNGLIFESSVSELGQLRQLLECPVCLAWERVPDTISSERLCKSCGAELGTAKVHTTYEPYGFITSLSSTSDESLVEQLQTTASKSSIAEAEPIKTRSVGGSNLSYAYSDRSQLYRLNKGVQTPAGWSGWTAQRVELESTFRDGGSRSRLVVKNVWLADSVNSLSVGALAPNPRNPDKTSGPFYIAAPKVTDSLILEFTNINKRLSFYRTGAGGEKIITQPFRAGGISALNMLTSVASRLMDVDAEEFEIIEPRLVARSGGVMSPVLQIADELVNGSGLTSRLLHEDPFSKNLLLLDLIKSIVDTSEDGIAGKYIGHGENCATACYRCLHRYGNQPYHGLLDWRLGLDVLLILLDSSYDAGLSASAVHEKYAASWVSMARKLAIDAAKYLSTKYIEKDGLFAVEMERGSGRWGVIVHPFWDANAIFESRLDLSRWSLEQAQVATISTFDLSRSLSRTLSRDFSQTR